MSKSDGNFVTIRDALNQQPGNRWWGEIVRFNWLRTHYRQPIDWTHSALSESMIIYGNFQRAVTGANMAKAPASSVVMAALCDDLNTPSAIAELHNLAVQGRSASGAPADAATELAGSLRLLR